MTINIPKNFAKQHSMKVFRMNRSGVTHLWLPAVPKIDSVGHVFLNTIFVVKPPLKYCEFQ